METVSYTAQPVYSPLELGPTQAERRERAPYGVIDMGSNSIRLVVHEQLSRAPLAPLKPCCAPAPSPMAMRVSRRDTQAQVLRGH